MVLGIFNMTPRKRIIFELKLNDLLKRILCTETFLFDFKVYFRLEILFLFNLRLTLMLHIAIVVFQMKYKLFKRRFTTKEIVSSIQ